ncbi:MAG: T9SS type A sorting domain-containing protein [Candidatus Poribacteria bacterium]|nr:T9SS type A sorting domain-containing protein [Candidatus Poribacteria bacterium]
MKTTLSMILIVFFMMPTLTPNAFAQDSLQWGLPEGAKVRLSKGSIAKIAYSPDGTRLAVASSIGVWIYDAQTGQELDLLPGSAYDVAFSPDGQTQASADGGEIRLWDVNTGRHIHTLEHTDAVWGVAFSPDGSTLASGSSDGTVLLWDTTPTSPEPKQIAADVNKDGIVNIIDLTLVASNFGKTGQNTADVNSDSVVNIVDLTLVAGAFGTTAGAPSMWNLDPEIAPTRTQVEQWLREARQMNLTDSTFQRGILILEQLLASLTPKETALLPNYPNPFNPETWIPYQLSEPAEVSISIYSADGRLVRRLDLGHQSVGVYESRSRAAYWDGKNALGESVASGLYFYTLTAGDFTATRRMLIRK